MTKDVYDVKKYVEFANKSYSWNYFEKPTIAKILGVGINKNTRIIEAGCGEGRLVEYLLSLGAADKNIIGIDLSEYLLSIAEGRYPKVKWIESSIGGEVEGIENDSTDLVTCSMVLNYLDNKQYKNFLRNCSKWLRDGGKILIVIPHPIRMVSGLDKYFDRIKCNNKTPWGEIVTYYHRTITDYVNEVLDAGFEIKELVEPELSKKIKKDDIKSYNYYSKCPMRLVIWAVKK